MRHPGRLVLEGKWAVAEEASSLLPNMLPAKGRHGCKIDSDRGLANLHPVSGVIEWRSLIEVWGVDRYYEILRDVPVLCYHDNVPHRNGLCDAYSDGNFEFDG